MTSFHLKADTLDQSFIEKLKSLFAHKEIDIFVRESNSGEVGRADGISRLLANPVGLQDFKSPSKDEIYSRD